MTPPAFDTVRFLKDQIDKPSEDSKKFQLIKWGMVGTIGVFILSAILLFVKPDLAGNLTSLAQIVITAYAGLVAVGCGSIAAVDFRNSASLQNVVQTVTEAKVEEQKIESNQPVTRSNFYGDEAKPNPSQG
jgi:hypothetical protein